MIRIQVPATSANLGPGFDTLGIALNLYNQVWMEESDSLMISSRDSTRVPEDATNLVYRSAEHVYEECGRKLRGLHILQLSPIPMARGLGSSSACIVAGICGANNLLGNPLKKQELVDLAAKIEGHPDNTTPCLEGGLVASAVEGSHVYSTSVPVTDKIRFVLFVPPFELKTEKARAVLPQQYSRADAVYNISRTALMVESLLTGDLKNLHIAVQDKIHQPYRAGLVAHIDDIFRMSYELGSLGTYLSGAGPTIVSMVASNEADIFSKQAEKHFVDRQIDGWNIKAFAANANGAEVFTE